MKIKCLLLIVLFMFACVPQGDAQVINRFYAGTAPTGDSDHAIDSIDGDILNDKDTAQAITSTYEACFYVLDADRNQATSSETPCPRYIRPTSNPGTKSWVLVRVNGYELAAHVQAQESIVFTNGSWNCDLDGDGSCTDSNEVGWDTGVKYLEFPDGSDTHADSMIVRLPDYFDETDNLMTAKVFWHSGGAGDVVWCLQYRHCNVTIGGACAWTGFTTECLSADTGSGVSSQVNEIDDTPVSNSDVDAWQAGDLIQLRIYRDGDAGGDTNVDPAYLDGVTLVIERTW